MAGVKDEYLGYVVRPDEFDVNLEIAAIVRSKQVLASDRYWI